MVFDRTRFIGTSEELVARHGAALRSLVGEPLTESWIAWDEQADVWWPDEAVILGFGDRRLEIAWFKLNEVALTWGEIDFGETPRHIADWGNPHLAWKRNGHAVLERARGGTLEAISMLEYLLRIGRSESWCLNGLEFHFSSGVVSIFNALDQNGLEDRIQQEPDYRRFAL